jgi:hypothetical protein
MSQTLRRGTHGDLSNYANPEWGSGNGDDLNPFASARLC